MLRTSARIAVEGEYFSVPHAIEFPTERGLTAHALVYYPTNPEFEAPEGERPPLIVISHGGPTGNAAAILSLDTQFWTSRGFAVVDVNYGGSTGYGRAYRERLNGEWGVIDLEDCVNAARYLVDQGDADPDRLLITGGSAGGYTTICALTFTDMFAAGATYFGIADLEQFGGGETHKFELQYEHTLIGPYPERADRSRERTASLDDEGLHRAGNGTRGLHPPILTPKDARSRAWERRLRARSREPVRRTRARPRAS